MFRCFDGRIGMTHQLNAVKRGGMLHAFMTDGDPRSPQLPIFSDQCVLCSAMAQIHFEPAEILGCASV